jgi:hypothetical protein
VVLVSVADAFHLTKNDVNTCLLPQDRSRFGGEGSGSGG